MSIGYQLTRNGPVKCVTCSSCCASYKRVENNTALSMKRNQLLAGTCEILNPDSLDIGYAERPTKGFRFTAMKLQTLDTPGLQHSSHISLSRIHKQSYHGYKGRQTADNARNGAWIYRAGAGRMKDKPKRIRTKVCSQPGIFGAGDAADFDSMSRQTVTVSAKSAEF
jgi:hypothetical protein